MENIGKLSRLILIGVAYFVFSFIVVNIICVAILRLAHTDAVLTSTGYGFPCHAIDKKYISYNHFARFFFVWCYAIIPFMFMGIGIIILRINKAKNKWVNYAGLIFANSPMLYSLWIIFTSVQGFLYNKIEFKTIFSGYSLAHNIGLLLAVVVPLFVSVYSIAKFFPRKDLLIAIFVIPVSFLLTAIVWFSFLGPLLL